LTFYALDQSDQSGVFFGKLQQNQPEIPGAPKIHSLPTAESHVLLLLPGKIPEKRFPVPLLDLGLLVLPTPFSIIFLRGF